MKKKSLLVINLKIKLFFLHFWVTNRDLKNKKKQLRINNSIVRVFNFALSNYYLEGQNSIYPLSVYWLEIEKYQILLPVTNSLICFHFRVNNSKGKLLLLHIQVSNWRLKKKKRKFISVVNLKVKLLFFHSWVTNSKLNNKKLKFELIIWVAG